MDILRALNFAISSVVCVVLIYLLLILPARKETPWQLDAEQYPNTSWALRLWGCWWLTLLLIYLVLTKDYYGIDLLLSDFGNLCAIGAAIAYCKDKDFKLRIIAPLLGVFAVVAIWDITMTSLPSVSDYYQGRIVTIAPSLLVSGIASLALGWAVVVRSGWGAWPFLLFAASYSVAQLPAYFLVFVLQESKDTMGVQSLNKLDLSLLFLAIGKVIHALAFLGYFFSTDNKPENFMIKEYWPDDNRKIRMHPRVAKWFSWAILLMLGSFLTALAAALVPEFMKWIGRLVGE